MVVVDAVAAVERHGRRGVLIESFGTAWRMAYIERRGSGEFVFVPDLWAYPATRWDARAGGMRA